VAGVAHDGATERNVSGGHWSIIKMDFGLEFAPSLCFHKESARLH
jgi:hypothetical protein